MIGIYKITSPSNRIYIGQSINIERRFTEYFNINKSKGQIQLHRSFKKYGVENHKFEIIEECEEFQLNERERYWQDYYDVLNDNGLNCRLTATYDKSGYLSKEVKEKISKIKQGKILSEETKDKIRKSHHGLKPNKITRLKMSNSARNRIKKPHSKQYCKNISKGLLGRKLSEKHRLSMCKKVIDLNTNIIYNSVEEAANIFNLNRSTLTQYLGGSRRNKTTLKYLEE